MSTTTTTTTATTVVFHQNTSLRRSIIASYWLVVFLALPLWWHTTSIQRLALPVPRVESHTQTQLRLPIRVHFHNARALQDVLERYPPDRWKGLDVRVVDTTTSTTPHDDDDSSTYTIVDSPTTFVSGRMLYCPTSSLTHVSDLLTSLLVPFFTTSQDSSDQRVVPYSPRYRLAFSLLNEDAAVGGAITGWDITRAIRRHISPILTQLSTLHNFTIESQIQFHAPLAFKPTQLEDEEQGFGLTQEQLTVFVNSAEWSLSSSASNDPVLHFVLFVPSLYHSPLRIITPNNLSSSAFLLPQWGTILLYNPPNRTSTATTLSISDLDPLFHSFATQLLLLLGAPALPPTISTPPQTLTLTQNKTAAVLTDWQLDALKRRRTLENLSNAKGTLTSIVKLVSEIENMPVGRDVRDDVVGALNELDQVNTHFPHTLTQTLQHSARALTLSSRAFFNPGMLALLYFPAEHKYAVYTPLFASAMIPMVVTALREVKAWRMERRQVQRT